MRVLNTIEKRRGIRILVFEDRQVEVDAETLLDFGFSKGSEINDDELETLIAASANKRAYENALYILEYRSHSCKELAVKLRQKGHSQPAAEEAVRRLTEQKILNDYNFAQMYAEELLVRKKYGKRRVYDELYRKGIDRNIAEAVVEGLDYSPENSIEAVISRKFNPVPGDEKGKRRMFSALLRLGYGYGEIKNALSKLYDVEYGED